MAEYEMGIKLQQNGSIDFDAYRADATRLRNAARDDFVRSLMWALLGGALGRPLAWGMRPGESPFTDRTQLPRSAATAHG